MKFGTLINSLALKAGITSDNKVLIDLLSKTELSNFDIADEVANKIETSLFDIESAKNSPLIKNHFFAQAYNGLDAEMDRIVNEFSFDENELTDYKAEKSTPKKVTILSKKIAELTAKKHQANKDGNKGKEDEYKNEIDKLNNQLKTIRTDYEQKLNEAQSQKLAEIADLKMDFTLSGKKYANADLPTDVNVITAKSIIQKEALAKGAKIIYNPATSQFDLVRIQDETLPYYDEKNNKVSYDDFVNGVLTQNKLLAVSDPTQIQRQTVITGNPADSGIQKSNSKFLEAIDANIADLTGH